MTLTLPAPVKNVTLARPAAPAPVAPESGEYERGLRDGENRLREQLLAQRNEFLALQHGVLDSLRQAVPGVVRDAESHLINLALEAAQKVVAGIPLSPELVTATVREALAQVEDTTHVTVTLHPDDRALLAPDGLPGVEFTTSADLGRGGCLVQTNFGVIDARRETKLANLREALQA